MNTPTLNAQVISINCNKEDDGKLIVDVIAKNSPLSKSLVKKLMMFGAVHQVTEGKKKRARKAKRFAKMGDILECYFDPKINIDEIFNFKLLHEDKHYGIYHKPMDALTEGTDYGDQISLFRHVEKTKQHAFIVNRMDKETEGIVVVAYDSKTQNLLQSMWRKDVVKKYQAIIMGELEGSGEFTQAINNKFSQTKYECLETVNNLTYVDITPSTERKHQIRIHFSNIGYPIIGDPLYGKGNKNKDGLQLVSYYLEFKDPYTDKLIKASLPPKRLLFQT